MAVKLPFLFYIGCLTQLKETTTTGWELALKVKHTQPTIGFRPFPSSDSCAALSRASNCSNISNQQGTCVSTVGRQRIHSNQQSPRHSWVITFCVKPTCNGRNKRPFRPWRQMVMMQPSLISHIQQKLICWIHIYFCTAHFLLRVLTGVQHQKEPPKPQKIFNKRYEYIFFLS